MLFNILVGLGLVFGMVALVESFCASDMLTRLVCGVALLGIAVGCGLGAGIVLLLQ